MKSCLALLVVALVAFAAAVPVSHAPKATETGLDQCTLCKELVGVVEDALQQNKTLNEVTTAVQDLCNAIGNTPLKAIKPECDALAARTPEIVAWIVDDVSADQVCQLIGACSSTEAFMVLDPKHLNLDDCTVCQELVGLVESELQQNSTETKIQEVVNDLCNTLANSPLKSLEPECRAFADNINLVIKLLLSKETPEAVCTQIKFCNASSADIAATLSSKQITKSHVDLDDCSICEELVQVGEAALQQNKTVEQITALVQELCAEIDKTPLSVVSKECEFVADHVNEIVQLLLANVNANGVCSALGMCSAQRTFLGAPVTHKFGVDKCEVCEELLTLVEFDLQQNATQAKIQNVVDEACAALQKTPLSELYPECELVSQNLPSIVAALLNLETPAKVCGQIKLC